MAIAGVAPPTVVCASILSGRRFVREMVTGCRLVGMRPYLRLLIPITIIRTIAADDQRGRR